MDTKINLEKPISHTALKNAYNQAKHMLNGKKCPNMDIKCSISSEHDEKIASPVKIEHRNSSTGGYFYLGTSTPTLEPYEKLTYNKLIITLYTKEGLTPTEEDTKQFDAFCKHLKTIVM